MKKIVAINKLILDLIIIIMFGQSNIAIAQAPSSNDSRFNIVDGRVKIFEFMVFSCKYCQPVHSLLLKLKNEFDCKVELVTIPLDWNGVGAGKLYYVAEKYRKEELAVYQLFKFSDTDLNDFDKLSQLAYRIGISEEYKNLKDSQEITDLFNSGLLFAKQHNVNSVPLIMVNDMSISRNALKYKSLKELIENNL